MSLQWRAGMIENADTWLTANSFLVSNAIVAAAVPFLLADMVLEAVIPW